MSNDKLLIGVGQALEIQQAFRREGPWTNEEIKIACERKGFLTGVRNLLHNRAEIRMIEHLVNCYEVPFTPEWLSILPDSEQLPNRVKGLYKLDVTKVILHLSKGQKKDDGIKGNKLRKRLKKEAVLPANILDFLLKKENLLLIPQEWKGKGIFFWGTIYRNNSDDRLCVRYLVWDSGLRPPAWRWRYDWLGDDWHSDGPSAVLRK